MSKTKRRLIDKFEIPINHLDFDYVKSSSNIRELEKILRILYSGEEGYYEELTKCTEDRLRSLAPNSKCFRFEKTIIKKNGLNTTEWQLDGKPVLDWSDEVKVKDNFLTVIANEKGPDLNVPEVRGKNKRIGYTKEENKKFKNPTASESNKNDTTEADSRRIKSTDYGAWDKYDAETECLKMELDEERIKEENERKNIQNEKEKKKEMITPVNIDKKIYDRLTNVEKETLSLKHKDLGNDYFRVKEYDSALKEYTKSLEIYPSSKGYNNRAIAYMKLLQYSKAVEDLDKCLDIEPKNIKALLRKALAFIEMDKRRDAYTIYTKIISIEPSNIPARNGLSDLKKQLPDLAPLSATRISIDEDVEDVNEKQEIPQENDIKNDLKMMENQIKEENQVKLQKEIKNEKPKNTAEITATKNSDSINDKTKNMIKTPENSNIMDNKAKAVEPSKETTAKNEIKKVKPKSEIVKDDYIQEDLAKLIIPKRIVKSKLSKSLDLLKNTKIPIPKINPPNKSNNPAGNCKIPQIKLHPNIVTNANFIKEIK